MSKLVHYFSEGGAELASCENIHSFDSSDSNESLPSASPALLAASGVSGLALGAGAGFLLLLRAFSSTSSSWTDASARIPQSRQNNNNIAKLLDN